MNMYGICLAVALAVCACIALLLSRRVVSLPQGLLLCGIGAVAGLITARLVYWLGALDFYIGRVHSVGSFFWWSDGGFSLFGAVAGAIGATWLVCRLRRLPITALDAFSLPVLLFAAEERLLEWTVCGLNFGMAMERPVWLTVQDEYGRLLNVALIEAILLALMAAGLLVRAKQKRRRSLPLEDALFLLGLTETLMISMRSDTYMMWGFVHQEQLYFYLLAAGMAILAGIRQRKALQAFGASLATAAVIVFLEFALDGRVLVPFAFMRSWADEFWYFLFIAALVGFALYYFRLRLPAREEQA